MYKKGKKYILFKRRIEDAVKEAQKNDGLYYKDKVVAEIMQSILLYDHAMYDRK